MEVGGEFGGGFVGMLAGVPDEGSMWTAPPWCLRRSPAGVPGHAEHVATRGCPTTHALAAGVVDLLAAAAAMVVLAVMP